MSSEPQPLLKFHSNLLAVNKALFGSEMFIEYSCGFARRVAAYRVRTVHSSQTTLCKLTFRETEAIYLELSHGTSYNIK